MTKKSEVIVYQAKNGAIELKGDSKKETLWATQKQLADVFGVDIRTVNEHIQNIFKTKELNKSSTIRNFRIVQKEGNRSVSREIEHYNLDMIISVGYRVNSKTATNFRKWATKTLKQHITQGYTINERYFEKNKAKLLQTFEDIKLLAKDNKQIKTDDILKLINVFRLSRANGNPAL